MAERTTGPAGASGRMGRRDPYRGRARRDSREGPDLGVDGEPGAAAAPGIYGHEEEVEVELVDYLIVLVRRRWLVLAVTAFCGLATALHTLNRSRTYRVEAVVLPAQQTQFPGLETVSAETQRRQPIDLYVEVLGSAPLLMQVLQHQYDVVGAGGAGDGTLTEHLGQTSWPAAAPILLSSMTFKANKTGSITISTRMDSPEWAAAVVNEFIDQLIAFDHARQAQASDRQVAFVDQRVAEVQDQLMEAEAALAGFLGRNRDLAMVEDGRTYVSPELFVEQSRLERHVQVVTSMLITLLNARELSQLQAKRDAPVIEVLAPPELPALPEPRGLVKRGVLGTMVGFMGSVFLAFFLEYWERCCASGRMAPVISALGSDVEFLRHLVRRGHATSLAHKDPGV